MFVKLYNQRLTLSTCLEEDFTWVNIFNNFFKKLSFFDDDLNLKVLIISL